MVLLAVLAALSLLTLVWRPDSHLMDYPLCDDTFYSLSVSRNLAQGHGLTIDGEQLTNGFQPLNTFISALGFVLAQGDRRTGVRFVYLTSWLWLIASGVMLGRITRHALGCGGASRRVVGPFVALSLWGCPAALDFYFNGLETGLVLCLVGLLWLLYIRMGAGGVRSYALLGAAGGMAVLSRIDVALLIAMFAGWHAFGRRPLCRRRILESVAFAVAAGIVSSPWWLYNVTQFGHLMPTSGLAQHDAGWSPIRWRIAVASWARLATAWCGPHFRFETLIRLCVVALGAAVSLRTFRSWTCRATPSGQTLRTWEFTAVLAAYGLVLLCYYASTSGATYFYSRYLAPTLLVSTVLWCGMLLRVLTTPRGLLPVSILLFCFGCIYAGSHHARSGLTGEWRWDNLSSPCMRDQLALVTEHVPEGQSVAAGQSGSLGFMRDRAVNMDGKVNVEALRHRWAIHEYLMGKGIRYYCDWPECYAACFGCDPALKGWRPVANKGRFVLLRHDGQQ